MHFFGSTFHMQQKVEWPIYSDHVFYLYKKNLYKKNKLCMNKHKRSHNIFKYSLYSFYLSRFSLK